MKIETLVQLGVFLTQLTVSLTISVSLLEGRHEIDSLDRGLGYKTKSRETSTMKPIWRPIKADVLTEPKTNGVEQDPDMYFSDDYYDNYDGEVEGTRRNINLHHTFEERMKTYIRLMQPKSENPPQLQDPSTTKPPPKLKEPKVAPEKPKEKPKQNKKTKQRTLIVPELPVEIPVLGVLDGLGLDLDLL